MKQYSISVIIPAYNVEEYIGAALQSLINQTIAPDELIIINDGSSDNTLSVIDSFRFGFPVKVVSVENGGQGNARNLGVSMASSEYVYFFDSDDVLADTFIASIKECILKSSEPDIILFSGESFNDDQYNGSRWVDYSRGFFGYFTDRVKFLNEGYKNKGLFCSPCLYISKKSLWGENALKFKSDYLEDEAVFYPLLFSCNTFCVLDKVFFYRRNRNDSTMTVRPNPKHVRGALNCMDATLQLYQAKDITEREKWHVKKRLERNCTTYCRLARASRQKLFYRKIIEALVTTKSVNIALVSLLYAVNANELKVLHKIKRLLDRQPKKS